MLLMQLERSGSENGSPLRGLPETTRHRSPSIPGTSAWWKRVMPQRAEDVSEMTPSDANPLANPLNEAPITSIPPEEPLQDRSATPEREIPSTPLLDAAFEILAQTHVRPLPGWTSTPLTGNLNSSIWAELQRETGGPYPNWNIGSGPSPPSPLELSHSNLSPDAPVKEAPSSAAKVAASIRNMNDEGSMLMKLLTDLANDDPRGYATMDDIGTPRTPTQPLLSTSSNSLTEPIPSRSREEAEPAAASRSLRFTQLWMNAFVHRSSLDDLNTILDLCSKDWREKAFLQDPEEINNQPLRDNIQRKQGRRQQGRQQQILRKRTKFNADEASNIQRLFRTYPRKAVKKILEENSPNFSGDVETAKEFLLQTYFRPSPSIEECAESRRLFGECNWSIPSEDEDQLIN